MIKPLYHYVVLEQLETEKKTASGIILPDKAGNQPAMAIVIAVGPGKVIDGKSIPLQVKVQDRVIYKKYATTEVTYENKMYLIVSEDDILAVME